MIKYDMHSIYIHCSPTSSRKYCDKACWQHVSYIPIILVFPYVEWMFLHKIINKFCASRPIVKTKMLDIELVCHVKTISR